VSFEIKLNGVGVFGAGLQESACCHSPKENYNKLDINWTKKSIFKLSSHMAMVPVSTVLSSRPLVGESVSRLDSFLGQPGNAIYHLISECSLQQNQSSYLTTENPAVCKISVIVLEGLERNAHTECHGNELSFRKGGCSPQRPTPVSPQ
jgi:hypothetical protein